MLAHFLTASLLPAVLVTAVGLWYVRGTLSAQADDLISRSAKAGALLVLGGLSVRSENIVRGVPDIDRASSRGPASGITLRLTPAQSDDGDATLEFTWRRRGGEREFVSLTEAPFWNAVEETVAADGSIFCIFDTVGWSRVHCSPTASNADVSRLRRIAVNPDAATSAPEEERAIRTQRDLFLAEAYDASDDPETTAQISGAIEKIYSLAKDITYDVATEVA